MPLLVSSCWLCSRSLFCRIACRSSLAIFRRIYSAAYRVRACRPRRIWRRINQFWGDGRSTRCGSKLETGAIGTDGKLVLRMSVSNESLGTVPIVYQENNIVIADADDSTNGLGIIIDPAPAEGVNERSDPDPETYVESDIRLLGPRQKCGHAIEVTAAEAMITDGGLARAYYRISIAGIHQPQSEGTRQLFPDQGLAILSEDLVFSEEVEILARA